MAPLRALSALLVLAAASAMPTLISELPDIDEDEDDGELLQAAPAGYAYGSLAEQMLGSAFGYDGGGGFFYDDADEEPVDEARVKEVFAKLDADKDGKLSVRELRAAVQAQLRHAVVARDASSLAEAGEILSDLDQDGDHRVDRKELDDASSMWLQHAQGFDRGALFAFADAGADGTAAADGFLDAAELRVLLFPESSARHADLRTLLVTAAMKAHDATGDNTLHHEEHLAFHKRRHGSASRPPRHAWGGAEHSGWAEHMAVPSDDEEGDEGDDDGEAELHAESFSWHDANGDGHLDAGELGEFLLPAGDVMHEGLVEEELLSLVRSLKATALQSDLTMPAEARQRAEEEALEAELDEESSFELEHVLEAGVMFADLLSSHYFGQIGELDRSEL